MVNLLIILTIPAAFALAPGQACPHRIYFLPQSHAPQDKTSDDLSFEDTAEIARSQFKILNFMDRFPQLPVFSEFASEDINAGDLPPDQLNKLRTLVAEAFPRGFDLDPQTLNETQKALLVDNGADTIQVMRGRLNTIHRVIEDQATDDRIFKPILAWLAAHPNTPYPPEIARGVYGEREREALRQVNQYFAAHPDAHDVSLVFGANHNFSFYPDLFPPQCITVPLEFRAEWTGQYRVGPEGFSPEATRTGVIRGGSIGTAR